MFLKDIELVTAMVKKYGLILPFADLGGLKAKDLTVADYQRTIKSKIQSDRYLHLDADPFTHIAGENYFIANPDYGHPSIEDMPMHYPARFGTAVCLNVIEHVVNPFEVFKAMYAIMQRGGLVIVTTVWKFPTHLAPRDFWRFSDECLDMPGKYAGFEVLEVGYHLRIYADEGILELHSKKPQEIEASFCVLRKT